MRTIRMTCFGFPDNLTVVLSDNFAGYSQYLYIVGKYKIIFSLAAKACQKVAFLPVSKPCSNKFYI
jgi:hypothetical protein